MENEISNLVSISKNKYSINLLETIEHKDLFQNINNNPQKLIYQEFQKINNINKDNNIHINNNYSEKSNSSNQCLNKSKNSSKSFKDIIKNKINNLKEVFSKYSPEKNIRALTQYNSGNINDKKKYKRNFTTSLNKKIKNNKAILKNNLMNFKNQCEDNNFSSKNNEYFRQSRNNGLKINPNFMNFNKSSKKDNNNNRINYQLNTYNEQNIQNNNNLDVYNRLYNKNYYKKKKNNIISSKEEDCTFNPKLLSKFNEKIEINNFILRQEKFNKYINQKKINLKKDVNENESKKCTFTPNTSCTSNSKYSIKLEAQRQDESKLDKTNRMVYDQIKKMQVKNNNLYLMYNNKYSFIPMINKKVNLKKTRKIELKTVPKIQKRKIISHKNDNKSNNNYKYINHNYDNVNSIYKNDEELMSRLKEENKKRQNKVDILRKEQENKTFEGYTFKPDINKNNLSYMNNMHNNIYNKILEPEISYTNNYNKKKIFQNKLNRSNSCFNKNKLYINSNINYNNINDLNNDNYYNNDDLITNDNYYNNYNNNEINYNNCNNNYFINDNLNRNYPDYNDYNIYNNQLTEYNNYINNYNEPKERSFSMGHNNQNYTYMYMTPSKNNIYKSRTLNNINKEDKENFLLIHKMLYDK